MPRISLIRTARGTVSFARDSASDLEHKASAPCVLGPPSLRGGETDAKIAAPSHGSPRKDGSHDAPGRRKSGPRRVRMEAKRERLGLLRQATISRAATSASTRCAFSWKSFRGDSGRSSFPRAGSRIALGPAARISPLLGSRAFSCVPSVPRGSEWPERCMDGARTSWDNALRRRAGGISGGGAGPFRRPRCSPIAFVYCAALHDTEADFANFRFTEF
jgi:hypothetical protein